MAGTVVETRSGGHFTTVIDLTLSDDDSNMHGLETVGPAILPSKTTPAASPLQMVDTPRSNHGLLLEGTFQPLTPARFHPPASQAPKRSSGLNPTDKARLKRFKERNLSLWLGRTSTPKRRKVDRSVNLKSGGVSLSVVASPQTPKTQPDHNEAQESTTVRAVSSKRAPQSGNQLPQESSPAGIPRDATTMPRVSGIGTSANIANDKLADVLRRQVFPYINKCLGKYRQSIKNEARKKLGIDVARKLCDEPFMENLEQNNGRLSRSFERDVSVNVKVLIKQFAGERLAEKRQDNNTQSRQPTMTDSTVTPSLVPDKIETKSLHNIGPSNNKSQKLSAVTKAVWKSSETSLLQHRAKGIESNGHTKPEKKLVKQTQPSIPVSALTIDSSPSESEDDNLAVADLSPIASSRGIELNGKPSKRKLNNRFGSGRRPLRSRPVRGSTLQKESFLDRRHLESKPGLIARSTRPSLNNEALRPNKRPLSRISSASLSIEKHKLQLAGLDSSLPRPYLSSQDRKDIESGLEFYNAENGFRKWHKQGRLNLQNLVIHVDFCDEEIEYLIKVVKSVIGETISNLPNPDLRMSIKHLMTNHKKKIPLILSAIAYNDEEGFGQGHERGLELVRNRTDKAITAFLKDAADGLVPKGYGIAYLHMQPKAPQDWLSISSKSINSILRHRETWGMHRNPRGIRSFKAGILNAIEDEFSHEVEWTDCSGDIATISWIPGNGFFCGATCHSDEHNMQYNKPGNLLIGSVSKRTLHSISGHQIVRPLVAKGENSRASMRGTQDPWMYCSVTSTAYSYDNQKCFTGSYDQTVKVWNVTEDLSSMELCGTWEHAGNVNFVVTSPHHGMIATAADVSENAVRVYHFNSEDISASLFDTYGQSIQPNSGGNTWAYFPATMQWGSAPMVSHLLLIGFSPRSFNCQDADIPEEKSNTGELCLWNAREKSQIPITTARTQNVFEVIWHPTQPIFVSATSPTGEREDHVRTQLRIFGQTESGVFCHMKTLDCPAVDINEITIMPNSSIECYVTASCTDGNTYVWDSAQGDRPIHVLPHGPPIDDQAHDLSREDFDVGVKFAAWGRTRDRFYTGSSDGAVKAWNIGSPAGKEFIRDVVILSGGVSAGAFSPDFSKLVIGDSSGKIHLLAISEDVLEEKKLPTIRQPVTPHAPLPHPVVDEDDMVVESEQTARERAHDFLERGQIIIHEDEYIGAIQGPNYASTGFFCLEGHKARDISKRVISEWRREQKSRYHYKKISISTLPEISSSDKHLHEANIVRDFDPSLLSLETLAQLLEDGADFRFENENVFSYESIWLGEESTIEMEDSGNKMGEVGVSNENISFDDFEVLEFQKLKMKLAEELGVRKKLDLVLKGLDIDVSCP